MLRDVTREVGVMLAFFLKNEALNPQILKTLKSLLFSAPLLPWADFHLDCFTTLTYYPTEK